MPSAQTISSGFPFESRYVDVLGSKMHYVDEGDGDVVLFLHGNPTSSYLWRNILPHVTPHARCIAPDLIGMGQSDKPDIAYRFQDHARYLAGFIDALELDRVTLVLHDWGSALGFDWARRHPDRVAGLAFMEAILGPSKWSGFPKDFRLVFRALRTPGIDWVLNGAMNVFVDRMLPSGVLRALSREDLRRYRAPYSTIASRRPLRQWPKEIPIDGSPADVDAIIRDYRTWLQETALPKLLFAAKPGAIVRKRDVAWCRAHLKNLEIIDLGPGLHFVQEDNPDGIGRGLAHWVDERLG